MSVDRRGEITGAPNSLGVCGGGMFVAVNGCNEAAENSDHPYDDTR